MAETDLGFGRVVLERVRGRFLNKDGTPNSRKYGAGSLAWQRLYLRSLAMTWPAFITWIFGLALLIAGVFAIGYRSLGPLALSGTAQLGVNDPFFAALVYSVGILSGIGGGPVVAIGSTAQWLSIVEAIGGLVGLIVAAGLTLARLSRPRARLRFSQRAVIAPYRDGRGFMFRVANTDAGEVSDAEVRVSLSWYEGSGTGKIRKFHPLPLERNRIDLFSLHWTVVHPIDPHSPLAGVTPEMLREGRAEFLVLITLHEETFSTRVTGRTSYLFDEVSWDAKFADMFVDSPDGIVTIDLERLDRMDRLAEGATSKPAALESAPRGPALVPAEGSA